MFKHVWKGALSLGILLTVGLVFAGSQSDVSNAALQPVLEFSPETVKDGGGFNIKVSGAPANSTPIIWVDNGSGYVDWGEWVGTDASGVINVNRTLNCSAYNTLEKGKNVAIGNRVLAQQVFLEFPGGIRTNQIIHKKDCTTGVVSEPQPSAECFSTLGLYSDWAPKYGSPLNNLGLSLGAGITGLPTDPRMTVAPASLKPFKITSLDPMPPGMEIRQKDITYAKPTVTGYDDTNVVQIYIGGTPTQEGNWSVRLRSEHTSKSGKSCVETGSVNITVGPRYDTPSGAMPTSEATPKDGVNGKIKYIKRLVNTSNKGDWNNTVDLLNVVAIKDKFVIDGSCGEKLGLWTASEDGSYVQARNACSDQAEGADTTRQIGHGTMGMKIFPDFGSDGLTFVHQARGVGVGGSAICVRPGPSGELWDCYEWASVSRSVVYELTDSNAESVSVSPLDQKSTYYEDLVMLKNRLITKEGHLLSIPDWRRIGYVPISDVATNGPIFGYGDFLIYQKTGKVYKVSPTGSKTLLKTLPHDAATLSRRGYDNSTWPSKIGFVDHAKNKVYVYKLTSNDMVLDKTISLPSNFPNPGAYSNMTYAIWGNYLVITNDIRTFESTTNPSGDTVSSVNTSNPGKVELWSSSGKLDEITLTSSKHWYAVKPVEVAISQNGYLAVRSGVYYPEYSVFLYKLNVPAGSSTSVYTPTSTPTSTPVVQNPTLPAPLPSDNECFGQYRNLCDQIQTLRKQLCTLMPTADICK